MMGFVEGKKHIEDSSTNNEISENKEKNRSTSPFSIS